MMPSGIARRLLGHAAQRFAHEVHPDGQRGARAFLAFAQRRYCVEAHPHAGDQAVVEAVEPGVLGSFVVPVLPRRSLRPSASARRPVPRVMTSFIMSFIRNATCGRDDALGGLRAARSRGQRRRRHVRRAYLAIALARSASDTASIGCAHSAHTVVRLGGVDDLPARSFDAVDVVRLDPDSRRWRTPRSRSPPPAAWPACCRAPASGCSGSCSS